MSEVPLYIYSSGRDDSGHPTRDWCTILRETPSHPSASARNSFPSVTYLRFCEPSRHFRVLNTKICTGNARWWTRRAINDVLHSIFCVIRECGEQVRATCSGHDDSGHPTRDWCIILYGNVSPASHAGSVV